MKTLLSECADWHESQAIANESSAALLIRFNVDGWTYHLGMAEIHRRFATAIREADSDEPIQGTIVKHVAPSFGTGE